MPGDGDAHRFPGHDFGTGRSLRPRRPGGPASDLPRGPVVSDGGDGVFHREDTLFFYGRDLIRLEVQGDSLIHTWHRYDDMNTYWLTWGARRGFS